MLNFPLFITFLCHIKKISISFFCFKKNFWKKIHFSQKMSKRFGSVFLNPTKPKLGFGSVIHCIDEVMVSAEWPKNGKFGDTILLYSRDLSIGISIIFSLVFFIFSILNNIQYYSIQFKTEFLFHFSMN